MTNWQPLLNWIDARERIRVARVCGFDQPWTNDPILAKYRFCNVRRRHDRVSVWIIESIIEPFCASPNLYLMLALARYVNWPDTLLEIMDADLWPVEGKADWRGIGKVIDARMKRGDKTWTGAYVIAAGDGPKKGAHVCEKVLANVERKQKQITMSLLFNTVQGAHFALTKLPGFGSFMAGQVVADYTYSPILHHANDLYRWAPLGPGSQRGLNRLAGRSTDVTITQDQAVREMIDARNTIILELGSSYEDLTLHDVQNCMCEVDKYLRVQYGEGKPRSNFTATTGRNIYADMPI